MLVSAIAWKNGLGNEWFEASKEYLLAWINTYEPEYHPINETVFDQLIQTYVIIKSNLSPQERSDINKYLYSWANGYITRMNNAPKGISWYSNWQSHRIKLITLIAVATDNDHLLTNQEDYLKKQIEENMNSEGRLLTSNNEMLFIMLYTTSSRYYRLHLPQCHAVKIGTIGLLQIMRHLKRNKLADPYVTGEKTHNEFINSKIKLDAIRKQRGLKNFNGIFRPEEAKSVYWLASAFNASYEPLALKLLAKPPLIMDWCN